MTTSSSGPCVTRSPAWVGSPPTVGDSIGADATGPPQPVREAWSTGAEVAGAPVADAPSGPD